MIVVCGEALIDLVATGPNTFEAHPGGGPFNTAVAVGRLGVDVAFLSRLSTDAFGRTLRDTLRTSRVSMRYVVDGPEPTSLAIAHRNERGEVSYSFHVAGAADRLLGPDEVPALADDVSCLHFGTLSLVLEPTASSLEGLMLREAGRRLIALDPNVRPLLIADRDGYLLRLERWLRAADLVRVSADDLARLHPEAAPTAVIASWLRLGPSLVVVTSGAEGMDAFRPDRRPVHVDAPTVDVADTIGAGDTVNGVLLASLAGEGALSRAAIDALDDDALRAHLNLASRAAAITCGRVGADPPWARELGL